MAVLELVLGLAALACLLYYYATATFSHWSRRGVPHLPPEPLFGNIKDIVLFRDLHVYGYQKLYHKFDGLPYAGLYQMRTPSLMLRDPETIKQFLVKDFAHFHDRGIFCDVERDPMSATLVNLSGRKWRNLRTKLTPSFSAVKLKGKSDPLSAPPRAAAHPPDYYCAPQAWCRCSTSARPRWSSWWARAEATGSTRSRCARSWPSSRRT